MVIKYIQKKWLFKMNNLPESVLGRKRNQIHFHAGAAGCKEI